MATMLLRRLAGAAAPIANPHAYRGQSASNSLPLAAIASISAGLSCFYYFNSPNLVHLDQLSEEPAQNHALNPDKWIEFKLQDKAKVSHNTQLYRFSFDPSTKLGLDVASCLVTRYPLAPDAEGKTKYVVRPYTPISDPDSKGHFDLLIKVYPDGKMSQHFASLNPGDVIEVKGPIEKLKYTPNMKKHIGMIAGGSGITPMLQIIEAILKNPDDNTKISLIYANVSPDDILLKKKLDVLEDSHPNLKIFYTVDNPSSGWRGGKGYISKDMAVKGLPGPGVDTLVLKLCRLSLMAKQVKIDSIFKRSTNDRFQLDETSSHTQNGEPELQNQITRLCSIFEMCRWLVQSRKLDIYPLIYRLIKLVLILPVSTATTEHTFSSINIIKTKLRNKMDDGFLDHCMLIYIEREIVKSFSTDSIIDGFRDLKERRALL